MCVDGVIYPSNDDAVFMGRDTDGIREGGGYLQRAMSTSGRFLCRERAFLSAFLHSEGKWAGGSMDNAANQ